MSRSKSAELAQWLEDQIVSGVWAMDTQIPTEAEIAAEHGVGRSTVREATRALVNLGMLESLVGRGTFVRATSPVNAVLTSYLEQRPLLEVLDLRRALESEAAALAAERRSPAELTGLQQDVDRGRGSSHGGSRFQRQVAGDFHADVFTAAGSPLLRDLHRSVLAVVRRAVDVGRLRSMPADGRVADHERILTAIIDGDPELARLAAAGHADRDLVPG